MEGTERDVAGTFVLLKCCSAVVNMYTAIMKHGSRMFVVRKASLKTFSGSNMNKPRRRAGT